LVPDTSVPLGGLIGVGIDVAMIRVHGYAASGNTQRKLLFDAQERLWDGLSEVAAVETAGQSSDRRLVVRGQPYHITFADGSDWHVCVRAPAGTLIVEFLPYRFRRCGQIQSSEPGILRPWFGRPARWWFQSGESTKVYVSAAAVITSYGRAMEVHVIAEGTSFGSSVHVVTTTLVCWLVAQWESAAA